MKLPTLKNPILQPLSRFFLVAGLWCIAFTVRAQTDTVWGVANAGGTYYLGTLFSMGSDGSNVQVAHSFGAPGDGTGLTTSPVRYKGIIYGLTTGGGSNGDGTIFSYNPVTAAYAILYNFDGTHGTAPNGRLTLDPANGLFYGTTIRGGADGSGVIFSFDPATNTYTDLYEMTFNTGGDGYTSMPMTLYNNLLYGINSSAVTNGSVIYSFNPATGAYAHLYDVPNGFGPNYDIALVGYNNVLYGSMSLSNGGNLFSFDLSSQTFNNEITFTASNGWQLNGLVLSGSTIYGVTYGGNYPDSNGTIFSYSLPGKYFQQLYHFTQAKGFNPSGNPVMADGKLLGLAYSGGASGNGVAYSYDPGANVYTDLLDFDFANNGAQPNGSQLLFIHPIGATPQTITFSDFTAVYGQAPFDPGASASSGLPVAYSSDNPQVAIGSGSQVRIIGAGTANITATQYGNKTYDSVSVTKLLTVAPAPLLITEMDTVRNQAQPNPVFRLSYSGLVNGDSAGSLTTPPTVSTTADSASPQGAYPITVNGAVDANYTITYQSGTLTVIGLLQQIVFSDSTAIYGSPDAILAAASSGLPVTYASGDPAIATITADQKVHPVSAGTTVITATQAGDAVYAPQTRSISFQVIPAPLFIIADNKTKVYSQPDPVFTATYNGFVNGDDSNSLTARPVFIPTAGPGAPPGVYLIHVDGAADSNYAITYKAGTYLLTPVEGAAVNSLNAWFSSTTSLRLDCWVTASTTAVVQVYAIGGQRLITKEVSLIQGNNVLVLPTAGLTSGVYIIQVVGDNLNLSKTIRKIN